MKSAPFHLLIAVDGSEGALDAVRRVAGMPFPDGTRVTLLHVPTRYTPAHTPLPETVRAQLQADEEARARAVLDPARRLLDPARVTVAERIADGHPAQKILDLARNRQVDLIVLGALGVTGWRKVLIGGTSQTVIKHAPCPVMLVRGEAPRTPFTVLAATDGSPGSRAALRFLRQLPLPQPRACHLLHVLPSLNQQLQLTGGPIDPPVLEPLYEIGAHLERRAAETLKHDAALLSDAFPSITPHTEEGDARRHILAAAETHRADLIVLGSRGLSGWKEFLLGSVAHKVARHSPVSVLLVPESAGAKAGP